MITYTADENGKLQKATIPNQEYVERTEIGEFTRDGKVVSDLYDATLQILFEHHKVPSDALRVFNTAYKICWMVVAKKMNYGEITKELYFNRNEYSIRDTSYCLAWALLTLHKEIYEFDTEIILHLAHSNCRRMVNSSSFRDIVDSYKRTFCQPINFTYPKSMFWKAVKMEDAEPTSIKVQVFNANEKNKSYLDTVRGNTEAILDNFKELTEENKSLKSQLKEQQLAAKKDIESERAKTELLRMENRQQANKIDRLNKELEEARNAQRDVLGTAIQHTRYIVKEINDPLAEVFSCESITEYGCGLPSAAEVNVVSTMISKIALRKQCVDPKIQKSIDKLDETARILHHTVINQTNNNCQQLYGKVDNPTFVSPENPTRLNARHRLEE